MFRRLSLAVIVAMCGVSAGAQQKDVTAFAWLAGVWEMSNGSRIVEEHWTTPSENMMVGMSRTTADGRTTSFEFLRIEKRGDDVFYIPQPGGRPPVSFKLTSDANGRYVFEQSGEDRVKKIEYTREGPDEVVARVEGVQGDKPFAFEYRYRRRGSPQR